MAANSPAYDDKIAQFQAITGLEDISLCAEILQRFGWDLDMAVGTFVGMDDEIPVASDLHVRQGSDAVPAADFFQDSVNSSRDGVRPRRSPGISNERERLMPADSTNQNQEMVQYDDGPGLAWRVATLPISVVRESFNMMQGALGIGMNIANGIVAHSLGNLGLTTQPQPLQADAVHRPLLPLTHGALEAQNFVESFEREYGNHHPAFQITSFMDALRRARESFRFLLVYLHSPDHEDTPLFVQQTLCSESLVEFLNRNNFIVWGGSIRLNEGFRISNFLKVSTFPYCAVIMASANQRMTVLMQSEGPKSSRDLVSALLNVSDEYGIVLENARIQETERLQNRSLRDEQDAAYQASLQADQEREQRRKEEIDRLALEAAEAERTRKEKEEAAVKAMQEAAAMQASIERRKLEKAMTLGPEPEKGPDVTEVLIRFPNGERGGRRFQATATISSVYDYIDSLPGFGATKYKLVSNFPRVVYDDDKLGVSLKDAELHPRASLYIQIEDE